MGVSFNTLKEVVVRRIREHVTPHHAGCHQDNLCSSILCCPRLCPAQTYPNGSNGNLQKMSRTFRNPAPCSLQEQLRLSAGEHQVSRARLSSQQNGQEPLHMAGLLSSRRDMTCFDCFVKN